MRREVQLESAYSCWVRKRNDLDIMASILRKALNGSKKTHIMYRCNLSHKQLEVYLNLLLGMGFLVSRSDSFKTTAKGSKFLDAYSTLKALMS